jgi:hypothetical protein
MLAQSVNDLEILRVVQAGANGYVYTLLSWQVEQAA